MSRDEREGGVVFGLCRVELLVAIRSDTTTRVIRDEGPQHNVERSTVTGRQRMRRTDPPAVRACNISHLAVAPGMAPSPRSYR